MNEPIIIKSEEDAFNLLEAYAAGALKDGEITLQGWPILTITLHGKQFDQSITVPVMRGLVELQSALNRSYAATKYGIANSNKLTDDEKKNLEIVVKVEKGSAKLNIDFQEIITATLSQAVDKMDPKTIAVTLIALGAIWAGKTCFLAYLSSKKAEKIAESNSEAEQARLEAMKFTSAEETKRVQLLTQVINNNSMLAIAVSQSAEAKNELLKSISHADYADVNGIRLTAETASTLVTHARRKANEIRVDGIYKILKNDTSNPNEFKVRVKNDNYEFDAIVQDIHLTQQAKSILQSAEWSRGKVNLGINAKSLDGEIKNAIIVSVKEVVAEKSEN